MDKKSENNTYEFSEEEIRLLDLFQTYIPKIVSKIKGETSKRVVEGDEEVDPSLNPIIVRLNDKDLEVIDELLKGKGFTFTSEVMMVHFLLSNPKNNFENEEKLVDYLRDVGGLEINKVSDILQSYNRVKDMFSNGRSIGEIPSEYLENRKYGIREYDDDGNKVLKWNGVPK